MTTTLPQSLQSYYDAKNRHDIDGMLDPFAANSVVHDEGKFHHGRAAIKAWLEETTRKYRVSAKVQQAFASGAKWTVSALVSGDFSGSPVVLTYRFTLDGEQIARLEIGA